MRGSPVTAMSATPTSLGMQIAKLAECVKHKVKGVKLFYYVWHMVLGIE